MFRDLILRTQDHRPWPMPSGPWAMAQSWHDLLFAHFPVAAPALAATLHAGLALDTFDGQAWISIVPFRMRNVRPRGLAALPWLSNFAELNVRTYVRLAGADPQDPASARPGVLFYSLDAANPLAVEIARRAYHLPYFNAAMRLEEKDGAIHYRSARRDARGLPGEFEAVYRPTDGIRPAQPGSLEHWLAERYALYAVDAGGRLYRAEIHHLPWPLQAAEVDIETNTLAATAGVTLPPAPPLVQFSRRLDVLVWPLQAVGRAPTSRTTTHE